MTIKNILKPDIYSIMIMGDIMFKNKKILILGMARSGYQAAKYLKKRGNEVILNDEFMQKALSPLEKMLELAK